MYKCTVCSKYIHPNSSERCSCSQRYHSNCHVGTCTFCNEDLPSTWTSHHDFPSYRQIKKRQYNYNIPEKTL